MSSGYWTNASLDMLSKAHTHKNKLYVIKNKHFFDAKVAIKKVKTTQRMGENIFKSYI